MVNATDVVNAVRDVESQYFRLVLIVSPTSSEKAGILTQAQGELRAILVKIGTEISQRLLEMTERQRALKVAHLLDEVLAPYPPEQVLILDNIEILFDQHLALNPLSLLQKISRNHTLIVIWNGSVQDGWLTYAMPSHSEYKKYPAQDVIIVQSGPSTTFQTNTSEFA